MNANAVLGTPAQAPVTVKIELDGKPVEKDKAGADVMWDNTGSYLTIKENRLYDIVRTKKFETHELRLQTSSDGFRVYSYTFG